MCIRDRWKTVAGLVLVGVGVACIIATAGAGAQKYTTDLTGNQTAGMIAGIAAVSYTHLIYMIVGIGFTCILIFALNMTSNYNVLVIALFILLIVCLLYTSCWF